MKKSLLLLFFCIVIWAVKAQSIDVAAEFADATVVYVSYANGTDATGRGNFSAPYKTIRYALQQATGKTWIKVSSGTQTENATVDLKSNVLIEGGYTHKCKCFFRFNEQQCSSTCQNRVSFYIGNHRMGFERPEYQCSSSHDFGTSHHVGQLRWQWCDCVWYIYCGQQL